jgi:Transmembrane secretion effector
VPLLPRSPNLRRILLAYGVNEVGTWLGYVALMVGVYDHTHSALATAGLLVAGRLLPSLLVPMVVARVEGYARRSALSLIYLVEAVTAAALALLLWRFSLPGILVLVAIDGTAALAANALLRVAAARSASSSANSPVSSKGPVAGAPVAGTPVAGIAVAGTPVAGSAANPAEIAERKVNAALNVVFSIAVPAGSALGALVLALASGPVALLIDAVSFLGCSALLIGLRSFVANPEGDSIRGRLGSALRHLREVPQLRVLLLTQAVALIVFFAVEPVEAPYVKASLKAGDLGFGLLMAAWGIGMVLGGIVFARAVKRPLGPMLSGGTLLVGLAYLGWAVAPTLAVACVAALVGGIGNGLQAPSVVSVVQQLTPVALQGRLLSAVSSVNALCPAIGFALGGALATLSSPRVAIAASGAAACAVTLIFLRLSLQHRFGAEIQPSGSGSGVPHFVQDP